MSNSLDVGSTLPAYCTLMGHAILSFLPKEEQQRILDNSDLKQMTPSTIYSPKKLLEELIKIQDQGYAIVNQELEERLCSIAVPIFDKSGKVIAAININTHISRNSLDVIKERFLPLLKKSANIPKPFFN